MWYILKWLESADSVLTRKTPIPETLRPVRFERTTNRLKAECSTTELRAQIDPAGIVSIKKHQCQEKADFKGDKSSRYCAINILCLLCGLPLGIIIGHSYKNNLRRDAFINWL
jgi:hypothetical protein